MKKLLAQIFSPRPVSLQVQDEEFVLQAPSLIKLYPVEKDHHYYGTIKSLTVARPRPSEMEAVAEELCIDVAELRKAFRGRQGLKKRVSLTKLMPYVPALYTNQYSPVTGPNCWNATLNWHMDFGIKHTTDREMMLALRDYYERIREPDLRYGDVIAFWHGTELQHTAIYLNNKFVWHKGGSSKERPWTFEKFSTVARSYYFSRESRVTFHRFKE